MAIQNNIGNAPATQLGQKLQNAGVRGTPPQSNNTQPNMNQAQPSQTPGGYHDNHNQQQPQLRRRSWGDRGGMAIPVARTPAAEALSRFMKTATKVVEAGIGATGGLTIQLIPMDSNQGQVAISVLVVAATYNGNDKLVGYHTLVMAASRDHYDVRQIPDRAGRTVENPTVPSDYVTEALLNKVQERVRDAYPTRDLLYVDSAVVPADFDSDNEELVTRALGNGVFAIAQELYTHTPGTPDLNLAEMDTDYLLQVKPSFGQPEQPDEMNVPIYAPIAVELITVPARTSNSFEDQFENTGAGRLATIGGYVDFLWAGQAQNPYAPQIVNPAFPVQPTPTYLPRLVLTRAAAQENMSIPWQLLSILNVAVLAENNLWMQQFRHSDFSENAIDLHDPGALNIEANIMRDPSGRGKPLKTKDKSFKMEDLFQFMSMICHPDLDISMDVPYSAGSSWYLSVFGTAAGVGEEADKANRAILKAAQILTNYHIDKYFQLDNPQCGPIVLTDPKNIIQLGYFTDSNGVRRDKRNVNYLAVLNALGEHDLQAVVDYSTTFLTNTMESVESRLDTRLRIERYVEPTIKVTGKALRVVFGKGFLMALIKAAADAGFTARPVNTAVNMLNERGRPAFLGQTGLSAAPTNLYNYNVYGQGSGGRSYHQPFGYQRSY